jgi:hypothetical protein
MTYEQRSVFSTDASFQYSSDLLENALKEGDLKGSTTALNCMRQIYLEYEDHQKKSWVSEAKLEGKAQDLYKLEVRVRFLRGLVA